MTRQLTLLATGLALLIGPQAAPAQQPTKVQYRSTLYLNVPQEKIPAFLEHSRTVTRKVMQERLNSNDGLESWALLSLLYRGSPALEYNYAASSVFSGPPPEPNPTVRDQAIKKATGMSYPEYMQKVISLSTVTGSVLARVEGSAPGSQMKEGNVVRVVRWKIEPNQVVNYGPYIRDVLAVQSQAVKEGAFLGWAAARVVSPGGPDTAYDAVTSFTHKDLASALQPGGIGSAAGQALFAKVHPQKSYTAYIDQGRAVRKAVRSELLRAVVVVDRPAGATSTSSR